MIFNDKSQNKEKVSVTSYGMNIKQDVPLKNLTTFKVGGSADYFCEVCSTEDLKQATDFSKQNKLPIFILGGGSNILISDSGFEGLVIKIGLKEITFNDDKLIAGAGENWDEVVGRAVQKELSGIENLSFIPGTVGGAVSGNIGAYGMEIKDRIEWVEVFDTQNLKTILLKKAQCKFSYRDSLFKESKGENYIITRVCFKLSHKGKPNLSYKDVKEYFKNTSKPKLKEVRSAIGKIRKNKFPDLNKYGTAGSFFKNSIIDGNKIHLARLLESLGMKGLREGDTGLYEKQPLVMINYGNASAKEIKDFSDKVMQKVFEKLKIKITPEIIFIGKF